MTPAVDPADAVSYRRVVGHFATGLTVVTASLEGTKVGFTCQSFTSVSLEPRLVGFFARRESRSWNDIRKTGTFCANILSAAQEPVSRTFATPGIDKFHGIETSAAPTGSPVLPGAIAWVDCDIESVTDAGDHHAVLGRVRALAHVSDEPPLLYFRGGYGRFAP